MNINPKIEAFQRFIVQPQVDGKDTLYIVMDRHTGRQVEDVPSFFDRADAVLRADELNTAGKK